MDKKTSIQVDNLYTEGEQWVQNLGVTTIHAKRQRGKYRLLKWLGTLIWLPFFLTPYIQWNGKQAVLFDMENRQYHLFDITIFSQDLWILAGVLLFLALILAAITTILGRVFCGFFCFQTVWTDIFTKIEEFFEGSPNERRKLEKSEWNFNKIKTKLLKHTVWLVIAILSGVTWMLYFGVSWGDYIDGNLSITTIAITLGISLGAYVFAGFMREQSCLWICPYARIQGVMLDKKTIIPTYDYHRGEKRGKLTKGEFKDGQGDCIDCHQCVAVCPTGVDIRKGQEYGCIACGLCIDACDSVMKKVNKPIGLIKYTSLDALNKNIPPTPPHKMPKPWIYLLGIFMFSFLLVFKIISLDSLDFKVVQDRSPLFVKLSDGSFRNKYHFKILNKSNTPTKGDISFRSNNESISIINTNTTFSIEPGSMKNKTILISGHNPVGKEISHIDFIIKSNNGIFTYRSNFITPKKK